MNITILSPSINLDLIITLTHKKKVRELQNTNEKVIDLFIVHNEKAQ